MQRVNKRKFDTFNDGTILIYRDKDKRTEFGAKKNVSTLDDMNYIARFDYEECSKREQDLSFAEQNSRTLSLKVKIRYAPGIDSKCKAVIDNYLYDVWCADKAENKLYLYMEGVKPI